MPESPDTDPTWDLDAARSFVATHGRVLDRRRLAVLLDGGDPTGVLAALDAYRNPDGGYGWALEPDHRSVTSQPVAAMHALEVLAEVGGSDDTRGVELCDWLAGVTLADGGVPFGLPHTDTAGSAGHWRGADASTSSLQMTVQLAAQAHRLARWQPDLADHPWLVGATRCCLDAIERRDRLDPYELMFALLFLDAAVADPRAGDLVDRFAAQVVADGPTQVPGGADGEALHLLDFSPYADAPSRSAFSRADLEADRRRLADRQQPDGGWTVDYATSSPAAALEWRGYATVRAVGTLLGAAL